MKICDAAEGKPQPTTLKFNSIDEQATWLAKNVPGVTETQARALLDEAFKKDTSVVIGGSRVRGDYTKSSDLDVGYGSLSKAKAQRINDKISDVGPLRIDRTPIIPGFESKTVPKIESPEEFFQRSGVRSPDDPKKPGQPFKASGSISLRKNGEIVITSGGGMICRIDGKVVPSEAIDYRDVGFGEPVDAHPFSYSIQYTKVELIGLLQQAYDTWLEDMRDDFKSTGDTDPVYLHELDFPPIETLLQHEQAFSHAIRIYLYIDLLPKSFPSQGSNVAIGWIINTIDVVRVESNFVFIQGEAFERRV